jgi:hypothetical protein
MGNFVKFDRDKYAEAVKSAIMDELHFADAHITNILRNSFSSVQLRKVDAKYKSAMLQSINTVVLNRVNGFVLSAGAGGRQGQQNQGFRAVYYEYGTGNKMQPPSHWSPSSGEWGGWNTARKGLDIYQRPRGSWTDLGGNVHKSTIKGAPQKIANKGVGEEIDASHWFRDSLEEILAIVDDAVRRAVKSVPISAYIVIRSIRKRM